MNPEDQEPDLIYLNNAATSYPKPAEVVAGVMSYMDRPPIHQARAGLEMDQGDACAECRRALASLFVIDNYHQIVFTSGATESLNLFFHGSNLTGRHVVTTTTEHNSVLRPLKIMEREGSISLSIVKSDKNGSVSPDSISAAIRSDTAAVVVNHCSNVTGVVNDITAIGKIVQPSNALYIVDVSQSAGTIDIDVKESNIDLMAFTGHKSLFGLPGIGGAYISENVELTPLKTGGTGVRSDYLFQPESMPMFYEAGTQNIPGIISLNEGLRYIQKRGIAEIHSHKQRACHLMRSALATKPGLKLHPAAEYSEPITLFSFTINGMDPDDIAYILENSYGIVARTGLHCAPLIHEQLGTSPDGSIRISPSCFTTDEEIDRFLAAIDDINRMCCA